MQADNSHRLRQIFCSVFELPDDAEPGALRAAEEPKWDSMATVTLIAAIESEFGITLAAEEALCFTSFAEVATVLDERGL